MTETALLDEILADVKLKNAAEKAAMAARLQRKARIARMSVADRINRIAYVDSFARAFLKAVSEHGYPTVAAAFHRRFGIWPKHVKRQENTHITASITWLVSTFTGVSA